MAVMVMAQLMVGMVMIVGSGREVVGICPGGGVKVMTGQEEEEEEEDDVTTMMRVIKRVEIEKWVPINPMRQDSRTRIS